MKQLPNILTLANLFCGSVACILVIDSFNNPSNNIPFNSIPIEIVLPLFCLSLIFDFLDGFAARAVKASSDMGKQLDSLADVVSFGLLPGLMMFQLLGGMNSLAFLFINMDIIYSFVPFCGLLITVFSAYRLAKFNLDKEQTYYFKGLPTPANAIFIFSLAMNEDLLSHIFDDIFPHSVDDSFLGYYIFLLVITVLSCWLLVSNIPLFSLKVKNFSWKDNSLVFLFLLIAVILFLIFKMTAVPFIILIYILLSLIFKKKIIKKSNLD